MSDTARVEVIHASMDLGEVDVQIGPYMAFFDVSTGERRWQDVPVGEVAVLLHRGGTVCARHTAQVGPGEHLELTIRAVSNSKLGWIVGGKDKVRFAETRKPLMGSAEQDQLTQQIWIGHVVHEDAFLGQLAERPDFYSDANFEAEGTPDHIAMSGFAEAMGETSYDHDSLEYGLPTDGCADAPDLAARFAGYSYAAQWGPLVEAKMTPDEVAEANAFILMGVERSQRYGTRRSIRKPRDFYFPGGALHFVGEISFPDPGADAVAAIRRKISG